MSPTTPLIIYKASAGSGKTFTLATEYIKLVIKNPQSYRKILAVTFTNKATEEMKMRILSQLYGIWKQLHSSHDYMEAVCKSLDVTPDFASHQAGIALQNLLHNYSYFRIDTIDSFFQSVMRNLARELDLTANLRVGLNDKQVEEMAVDQLVETLSAKDAMLQWIMKYIMENISDDRSWNVIRQVKSFGLTIFKEHYKTHSQELYRAISEPKFFERYTDELNALKARAAKHMKDIGDEFFSALNSNGFDIADLSYGKSGVGNLFVKLQNGIFDESIVNKRATDCMEATERWYKKSYQRADELAALAHSTLIPLLKRAIDERPQQWKLYKSAELTLRHLNQLRLLESIEKTVRELNTDANRFLLSDTQQMLHELIDGSDSPFIYEKIGTQLEHIMIDEFQDTSTVQWKNFKVLLQETMSHEGSESLIVGDVKQSIYRWRSGDWRLLANIEHEFPESKKQLAIKSLDTNYRSSRRIITFNNVFFAQAAALEGISAYDDVEQKVSPMRSDDGYVSITLLPPDDYQQKTLEELVAQVSTLISAGVSLTQIAILVRANKQIPVIANYFMEQLPQVRIVSDEAFRLDASTAVLVIVQALRLLVHPDDLLAKAYLAKSNSHQALHTTELDKMLPEAFTAHREELLRLPLYELTERLYAIFRLHEQEGQSAYLCAFYDHVASFVNEQMTDINNFLREWDETLCSKTIQSPDINGIRLISIHKSKGLEFPYVLVPFCDWKLEMGDTLWCQPDEAPFNQLPLVPIDYSRSGMKGTIYEKDSEEEYSQTMVDNMNVLYVAFTRASEGLYVWGRRGGSGHRSTIIEQTLPLITGDPVDGQHKSLPDATIEGLDDDQGPIHFEYGFNEANRANEAYETNETNRANKANMSSTEDDKQLNVFLQKTVSLPLRIEVHEQKVAFKQSNQSREFAAQDDEQQQTNYIQLGSVLHNVFSTIRTRDDIDSALQRMELDGILYDSHLTRERIEEMIRKRIEQPRVAEWYSKKWTLYNECTILDVDEHGDVYERRPDRVMTDGEQIIVIDFKFGRPNEDYKNQVRTYMDLLTKMGHKNIKGYLWYVYSNKIEEVFSE